MTRFLVIISILIMMSARAGAEELQLQHVLHAAFESHPKLAEARAGLEMQRGRALSAASAFEPTLKGSGSDLPGGYYDYWQLAASVEQTIPNTGIELIGGYRIGSGDIPIYYGERETLDGGELSARIRVPLLADRSIDKDRATLQKATIDIAKGEFRLSGTWLETARDASNLYWKWVAAGQMLRLSEELLTIARERAEQIRSQAASGAIASISEVDAERVLLARQSSYLQAQSEFVKAQQGLSLYYRDEKGQPIVASIATVPASMDVPTPIDAEQVDAWLDEAIGAVPSLRIIEQERQQAAVDLKQAKNLLLPGLDLTAFVARDMGSGPESLSQTDVGIGFSITAPLFRRQGRGLRSEALAKIAMTKAKDRGMRDAIAATIRSTVQTAQLAEQRVDIARQRLVATERLASAEQERLLQGASDLLTLNLRELDVASAASEVIAANLALHSAIVDLHYARGTDALKAGTSP